MKNKLESELNQNLTNFSRSKGNKILLVNSNYMLLHLNSMKYLCLNEQNKENL